ncbi:MAG: SGNH/GDSL hydrolase family protein [Bacteroidota bacterium]
MNRSRFLKYCLAGTATPFIPLWAFGEDLPNVLILGDSISIGYTPFVQELMKGKANVHRPMLENGKPENCSGTTNGVKNIDRWIGNTRWDVIHFNFGLHDLKHEDPETKQATKNPEDPYQADPKTYRKNLTAIVDKLMATDAKLIYATTTPVPNKLVSPYRDPEDVIKYNKVASKIMKKGSVPVNDLYSYALPLLAEIQRQNNVHFFEEGSRLMAKQVVEHINKYI